MFFEPEEILLQTMHIFLEEKGGRVFVKEDWGGGLSSGRNLKDLCVSYHCQKTGYRFNI